MRKLLPLFAVTLSALAQPAPPSADSLAKRAATISIVRDDWGIAHVHGKTDADAVFGMIYAQAEDDFNRIETNYLNAMGRLAEAEGESKIYQDLRMKLFINTPDLKSQYAASPEWLKKLMNAWADGLNYYLAKHPEVKPRVLTHFDPWMALSYTEGSIGGDIEGINVAQLAAFYGKQPVLQARADPRLEADTEPRGSNGIAIAPSNTAAHHSLLLINPHTSFFFRSELQMTSDEGLNAYGAATWGQFFIYQGFNERTGWMHTTSGVDAVDEYVEAVTKKGNGYVYRYGNQERPVVAVPVSVSYKTASGMAEKQFTVYRTHHGPVIRESNGKWVTVQLMREPIKALMQSYSRTKTKDYKSFKQTMELFANSSNNTIFADSDGDIAYFHGNFIPRRDGRFDFTKPVDGSDPASDWKGLLAVNDAPNLFNPASGWLYNANNWPWSAAGPSSLKRSDYPAYVEKGTAESPRGMHALRVLQDKKDFTLDSLIAAAYDSYLPYFEKTIASLPNPDPANAKQTEQVALLRKWDRRWAVDSIATSLAVFWATEIERSKATPDKYLQCLATASAKLEADFGTWKTPWGNINRFQRLTGDIMQPFNDAGPSIPVGFTSAQWGSLASFGARPYGTRKWYGTSGNSFVAAVEFGDRVRARAVTAGGESGHPGNPHFNDEATRYSTGNLRDVYFYPDQLKAHTERTYHPGQ